jgi:phage/plasmid-associated DNA primase
VVSSITYIQRSTNHVLADTDVANARRFVVRHGSDIRYTTTGGWYVWDGTRWARDEKGVKVQALAVNSATAIFDEIKDSADRDKMMAHAKRSQSRKSIEAMGRTNYAAACFERIDGKTSSATFPVSTSNPSLSLNCGTRSCGGSLIKTLNCIHTFNASWAIY